MFNLHRTPAGISRVLSLLLLLVGCISMVAFLLFRNSGQLDDAPTSLTSYNLDQCLAQLPEFVTGDPVMSPDTQYVAFERGGSHGCHVTYVWSCESQTLVYSGGEGACSWGDYAGVRAIGWCANSQLVLESRVAMPVPGPYSDLYYYDPAVEREWTQISLSPNATRPRYGWQWDTLSREEQAQIMDCTAD